METLIQPGYKHTELGWIPEEWEVINLNQISSKVGSGITPTGGQRVYKSEGRPFVRSQNVGWGKLILDEIAFIDEETHSKFDSTEIELFDVLLNITGASIGRSSIASKEIVGGNVNQHVCIIRPNRSYINEKFLNSLILSRQGQKQINDFQAGGNREGLNFYQVKSLKFPLPPLPEQQSIATALSDMDAYIRSLEQLIEKKKAIKQAAMQELLTPKEDWEVRKFEDVIDGFSSGMTPYRGIKDYYSGNIPWITSGELNYNLILDTEEKITEEAKRRTNLKLLPKGTFLMAITGLEAEGTRGSCGITGIEATTNQSCMALFPKKNKLTTEYLFHYYVKFGDDLALQYCQGTKQQSYTGRIVKKMPITIPLTIEEQNEIASTLTDMDVEINNSLIKLQKIKQIKQAMMHDLLTGKVRLV